MKLTNDKYEQGSSKQLQTSSLNIPNFSKHNALPEIIQEPIFENYIQSRGSALLITFNARIFSKTIGAALLSTSL